MLIKMTTLQRIKSDLATIDHRDAEDKLVKDNRMRNDELTSIRRFKADNKEMADQTILDHRIKNDEITDEKRLKADQLTEDHRIRNDENTANRRETKDGDWIVPIVNIPI